jgi:hypothetical protein
MNCWWVLDKAKHHVGSSHGQVARAPRHPYHRHRKAVWRWVCVAGPPLIGIPGIGIAYGWPFLSGWGLGPAEAAGSGPGGVITVPEPSSLLILSSVLALVLLARWRFQCRSR